MRGGLLTRWRGLLTRSRRLLSVTAGLLDGARGSTLATRVPLTRARVPTARTPIPRTERSYRSHENLFRRRRSRSGRVERHVRPLQNRVGRHGNAFRRPRNTVRSHATNSGAIETPPADTGTASPEMNTRSAGRALSTTCTQRPVDRSAGRSRRLPTSIAERRARSAYGDIRSGRVTSSIDDRAPRSARSDGPSDKGSAPSADREIVPAHFSFRADDRSPCSSHRETATARRTKSIAGRSLFSGNNTIRFGHVAAAADSLSSSVRRSSLPSHRRDQSVEAEFIFTHCKAGRPEDS